MLGLGQQLRALASPRRARSRKASPPARRFLRDIADARARRGLDAALVGLIDPGDHLQQRRLAGAVAADQADMRLRRQRRRGLVENEMAAQGAA